MISANYDTAATPIVTASAPATITVGSVDRRHSTAMLSEFDIECLPRGVHQKDDAKSADRDCPPLLRRDGA